MKNCNKCGAVLPDEAMFCTSCGAQIDNDFDRTTVLDDSFGDTDVLCEPEIDDTRVLEKNPSENDLVDNTTNKQNSNVNPAFVNPNYNIQNTQFKNSQPSQIQVEPYEYADTNNKNTYTPVVEQPTLKNCYKKFWQNYTNFSGRARRSEYWFVVLANFLIAFVNIIPYVGQALYSLYALAILVPTLALMVRRLHDVGKGWGYIFLMLIPLVGQIIMLVWFCSDSQAGTNKYGENPKGIN